VNFGAGGLELHVDGVQDSRTNRQELGGMNCRDRVDCGGDLAEGLFGDDPWVLGASAGTAVPGTVFPLTDPLRGGALDDLRVSRVARPF
jgi:hypothetical protein